MMSKDKNADQSNVDYSLIRKQHSNGEDHGPTLQTKLEAYQRIIREWAGCLSAHEFQVLMQIADRTIGWGQHSATMSVGSLIHGGGAYGGMQMSERTAFRVLKSLEEKQIIKRRKSGTGALRISINPGWAPALLNVPKREKERSQFDAQGCQSGTTPCRCGSPPCQNGSLYTGNHDTDNLNTDTAASADGGNLVSGKASPDVVREKIESARQANQAARQAKISRTKGRTDVATGIEATWWTALEETYPEMSHVVWDVRIKRNVKLKAKQWAFGSQITFDDLADWSVRNWSRIIKKQFGWMKQKAPPATPDIGFFLYFSPKFMEAWCDTEFQEWLKKPERTKLERLMAKGATREEAENHIAQDRAETRMAERNRKSEAKAAQMRREARMVRKQARDIADRANVPPRRRQRPAPVFVAKEVDTSELIVPQVPKENPFN